MEELKSRVATTISDDMVPALYPCLFKKPVQTEGELQLLVQEVERRTGMREPLSYSFRHRQPLAIIERGA